MQLTTTTNARKSTINISLMAWILRLRFYFIFSRSVVVCAFLHAYHVTLNRLSDTQTLSPLSCICEFFLLSLHLEAAHFSESIPSLYNIMLFILCIWSLACWDVFPFCAHNKFDFTFSDRLLHIMELYSVAACGAAYMAGLNRVKTNEHGWSSENRYISRILKEKHNNPNVIQVHTQPHLDSYRFRVQSVLENFYSLVSPPK